MAIDKII